MRKAIFLSLLLGSAGTVFCQLEPADSIFFQIEPQELNAIVVIENNAQFNEKSSIVRSSSNLDQVLEQNIHLKMIKRGGYAFDPVIHGMSSGQRSVTIDGMRIFGACTDRMDPVTSYVSTNNLSTAEVNFGTSSNKYGSNLNAGLNLETSKATFSDSLTLNGSLTQSYGSAAQQFGSGLRLNLSNKRWALKTTGTRRKADSYRAGGGEIIDFTQYNKENASANLRFKASNSIILEAQYIYDKATDVGYAALPMDVSLAESNIAQLSAHIYDLFSRIEKLTVSGYANRIVHVMDDTKRPPETIAMHMDMPGWSNTQGAFMNFDLHLSPKDMLEVRADYYHNYQFAEMIMYPQEEAPMYMVTWPGIDRQSAGIFLKHTKKINESLKVETAFRIDQTSTQITDTFGIKQLEVFNIDGTTIQQHAPISLNVGIQKSFNKKFALKVNTGYSERLPTSSEMYGYYLFNRLDGYDYIGDPAINRETSWKFSSSADYKNEKHQFNLTSSYQRINNFIYGIIDPDLWQMTIGANGAKQYTNIPFAQLVNISGFWKKNWEYNISTQVEATYTWGEKENKMPLPQLAPLSFAANINYTSKKWQALAEVQGAAAQNLVDQEFIEYPSESWLIVNIGAKRAFKLSKNKELQAELGVDNLLDNNYYQHLDWGKLPRPGVNVQGALTLVF